MRVLAYPPIVSDPVRSLSFRLRGRSGSESVPLDGGDSSSFIIVAAATAAEAASTYV